MPNDKVINLSERDKSHTVRLVRDLSDSGWRAIQLPKKARLDRNNQLIELRAPKQTIRVRIAIYKVIDRGEAHRRHERRIEITTTYHSGLTKLPDWADVVIGYEKKNDVYVGLDPRRLAMGGSTHNASSSVDPAALELATVRRHLLVRPHKSRNLGLEYQAVFVPERLAEYLFNYEQIHEGRYMGSGLFSGPIGNKEQVRELRLPSKSCDGRQLILVNGNATVSQGINISKDMVESQEMLELRRMRDLSPRELEAIRQKCREVGDASEYFVYQSERKRLARNGNANLAAQVEWISQDVVNRGYDIRSFDSDGNEMFIEVKGTIGKGKTFFISEGEWDEASKRRKAYWIYRVVEALDKPRILARIQDPVSMEKAGRIARVADGWRVTLK